MPPFSSPSVPPALWCLEWVLMFHDLHCIPFCVWMGAHLKLSVVLLLSYWCPYSPLLSLLQCVCVFSEGVLLVFMYFRVCGFFFYKHLECMCVWVPFIPWPTIPCQIKYWWKALNDLAPAHWPSKCGFKILSNCAVTNIPWRSLVHFQKHNIMQFAVQCTIHLSISVHFKDEGNFLFVKKT